MPLSLIDKKNILDLLMNQSILTIKIGSLPSPTSYKMVISTVSGAPKFSCDEASDFVKDMNEFIKELYQEKGSDFLPRVVFAVLEPALRNCSNVSKVKRPVIVLYAGEEKSGILHGIMDGEESAEPLQNFGCLYQLLMDHLANPQLRAAEVFNPTAPNGMERAAVFYLK